MNTTDKQLNCILSFVLGSEYNARDFYYTLMESDNELVQEISRAMDAGTNDDVRGAIYDFVNASSLESVWKQVICNNVAVMNWI